MSKIQNILISFGVLWLSLWVAGVLAWPFAKLNDGISCGDGVLDAVAMSVMSSMARTLAAVLAGVLVALVIVSRKSQWWALIVAVLYVADAPVRHRWGRPATAWDRLWQGVDLLFPDVACIGAAVVTARLRRKGRNTERVAQPGAAG